MEEALEQEVLGAPILAVVAAERRLLQAVRAVVHPMLWDLAEQTVVLELMVCQVGLEEPVVAARYLEAPQHMPVEVQHMAVLAAAGVEIAITASLEHQGEAVGAIAEEAQVEGPQA